MLNIDDLEINRRACKMYFPKPLGLVRGGMEIFNDPEKNDRFLDASRKNCRRPTDF
jgi:hypothetical protein